MVSHFLVDCSKLFFFVVLGKSVHSFLLIFLLSLFLKSYLSFAGFRSLLSSSLLLILFHLFFLVHCCSFVFVHSLRFVLSRSFFVFCSFLFIFYAFFIVCMFLACSLSFAFSCWFFSFFLLRFIIVCSFSFRIAPFFFFVHQFSRTFFHFRSSYFIPFISFGYYCYFFRFS